MISTQRDLLAEALADAGALREEAADIADSGQPHRGRAGERRPPGAGVAARDGEAGRVPECLDQAVVGTPTRST